MQVQLLHNTPLWVSILAIRKCWESENKADSYFEAALGCLYRLPLSVVAEDPDSALGTRFVLGPKDAALIRKVIKENHTSTTEHLTYNFELQGISRACLQELARHRIATLSVQSSRYTLKRYLSNATEAGLSALMVSSSDPDLDRLMIEHMLKVGELARAKGLPNDVLKYALCEAWKTELIWTVNARSLLNFLKLRTSKRALREIRRLAYRILSELPDDHRLLFETLAPERSPQTEPVAA